MLILTNPLKILLRREKRYLVRIIILPKEFKLCQQKVNSIKAKELMIEMSENYKDLLELFPENSKEGFKTELFADYLGRQREF